MPKAKPKKNESTSDSDSGPDDRAPPPKKSKDSAADDKKSGANSNQWVLERQRQVRINEFRGKKLIDIREYYEKNGEMLPGKKGISLSVTQWKKLLECADEINRAIEE
ncbi:RNA polymerase II transcriptional coactivator-like [Musca vetustissima]|uniref:RNA polymerase II transcriptional coactivator-like n=1 Tax=Musca vetustissima TaxID=27455 RepID=UPI002AB7320E|nr:RNA polymerase II transcriptional coactivator-like [Musca vetustissima]XP_061402346.1 RNA polymerase II transcriptional coactivator-like [Musca vetustissima]